MPKAGIEPARVLAPLAFESSASPSSATSACFIAGTAYRQRLAAWMGPRHNCPPEAAARPAKACGDAKAGLTAITVSRATEEEEE